MFRCCHGFLEEATKYMILRSEVCDNCGPSFSTSPVRLWNNLAVVYFGEFASPPCCVH